MRSPSNDIFYKCHRREIIHIDGDNGDDHKDIVATDKSDSQYTLHLRDEIALEMWSANVNRRA